MFEPFIQSFVIKHFGECIIVAVLCIAILLVTAGCSKNNDNDISSGSQDSISAAAETPTTPEPLDTPDTPDSPDTAKKKTPYDYPYEIDKIQEDLIAYGESLNLYYYSPLTIKQANSVVKVQTRSAENGKALEHWCKSDIDSIAAQAKYRNIEPEYVDFNITFTESPTHKGQYTITILSESD